MKNEKLYRLERLLFIISIGLCHCVRSGAIDVDEAGDYLFNPLLLTKLQLAGASEEAQELIRLGLEIEDTEMLMPENLGRDLDKLLKWASERLKESPESASLSDKWFTVNLEEFIQK
ncbi:DUF3969 family protein [Chitinivorax sp. B]|uniref:DUF3969 family protein n=1 Tax=Chitinivorax sp. B TaxID=2502235 RepID=UPI0010F5A4AB|nr:DUF3969 family protein [Chitinivorax sp. B]